jgi:hypothetical protein
MAQWPFAHECEMTYRLSEKMLEVNGVITNLSSDPMPVAAKTAKTSTIMCLLTTSPDQPADTILDPHDFPIDQESERAPTEFKIGEQLGLVNGQNRIDGLIFDEDIPFDSHIGAVRIVDGKILISDWDDYLDLDFCPSPPEFISQAFLVRGLEKSRP